MLKEKQRWSDVDGASRADEAGQEGAEDGKPQNVVQLAPKTYFATTQLL